MEHLKHQNPLYVWKEKVSEEGPFTRNRIIAAEKILDTYLENISKSKDNTDIWKAIEKAVRSFNKLNKQEDYFIDVPEREEMVDFIQFEAEKAGLKYAGDVTEEWRDEW